MLSRMQGMLLRGSMQQAARSACMLDAFQVACCRQLAVAAPNAHRLAADAGAAETSSAVQRQNGETSDVTGEQAQSHPLQLPDPLQTFRESNISMPQLEGQVGCRSI